jgi:hypothetical protein
VGKCGGIVARVLVAWERGHSRTADSWHVDNRLPGKAGTILGVKAHAVQSVPVTHVRAPVVVAEVRSRHIAVRRRRWCGDSEAPVRPDYDIAFHLATGGVSEERLGAMTAGAMRLAAW